MHFLQLKKTSFKWSAFNGGIPFSGNTRHLVVLLLWGTGPRPASL